MTLRSPRYSRHLSLHDFAISGIGAFWLTGPDYFSIWEKLADGEKSPKQSLSVLFSVFLNFQITVVTRNGMERYSPRPQNKALSLW